MSRFVANTVTVLCCNAVLGVVCWGAEQGVATVTAVQRASGATTPEKLAEKFFVALQENDKVLALSTIATTEILRKEYEGDADLPAILELNEALLEQVTEVFAKLRAEADANGFDWKKASIDRIKVSPREGFETKAFGAISLQFKVVDHPHHYEIEFDDGGKYGERWYFTDRIRGLTKLDSSKPN